MAKQADVNRRDSADSRVYPRPRKFPTSSTCGCLRVTKGYAHAIGSKVPEEIPTRSRKFVAPFASVVGQTHEGRQHAWEKWDGNNRGVTAVVGRGRRRGVTCARSVAGNNEGQQPMRRIRLAGTWKVMVLNLVAFHEEQRSINICIYIKTELDYQWKKLNVNNRSSVKIFNQGIRIFLKNVKILIEQRRKFRCVLVSRLLSKNFQVEKLEWKRNGWNEEI